MSPRKLQERYQTILKLQAEGMRPFQIYKSLGITKYQYYQTLSYYKPKETVNNEGLFIPQNIYLQP